VGAPTETFIDLFKRQPTEADRIRLMSVQKALRLPDDDPLWVIFLALDYYHKLYEDAPAKILEATQNAARTTISAAEASTTEKLVNGAVAAVQERLGRIRALQWPLVIVCALLSIALIGLGISFWFATQQFREHELGLIASHERNLAAAQEQFNKTLIAKVSEVQAAATAQLARDQSILDWAKQYRDIYESRDFQARIDFVVRNPVFVDVLKALENPQRDNILRLVTNADRWRMVYSAIRQPWPCFAVINKPAVSRSATACQVGLEGEPLPPSAPAGNAPPPPPPPRPKKK